MEKSLDTLVPGQPQQALRHEGLIVKTVDDGDFSNPAGVRQEHPDRLCPHGWPDHRHRGQPAPGAGRLPGHQELHQGRALFVRFCDAFNIPVVTVCRRARLHARHFQEYGGIIKHGAKLLYAYAECTVPKITVITRKAYGGAYDVMASKHLRGDVNLAWPNAEIAVMGAKGAVEIIFREGQEGRPEAGRQRGRIQGPFCQPVRGGRAWLHRRRDPAARNPQAHLPLAWMLKDKKLENPWRKHGNIS